MAAITLSGTTPQVQSWLLQVSKSERVSRDSTLFSQVMSDAVLLVDSLLLLLKCPAPAEVNPICLSFSRNTSGATQNTMPVDYD